MFRDNLLNPSLGMTEILKKKRCERVNLKSKQSMNKCTRIYKIRINLTCVRILLLTS